MIYFIRAVNLNRLKIGFTDSFETRFVRMARQEADELEVLGTIPGDETYERSLHGELLPWRIHHEWFDYSAPEVRDLVARELKSLDPSPQPGSL